MNIEQIQTERGSTPDPSNIHHPKQRKTKDTLRPSSKYHRRP